MEGALPEDEVFLADLESDPAERENLREQHPELVAELLEAATTWRVSAVPELPRLRKPCREPIAAEALALG